MCISNTCQIFLLSFTYSSQSFLQSIEQALVEGHQILVENITLPFYSAILPVIQAGLSWHKTDQRKYKT